MKLYQKQTLAANKQAVESYAQAVGLDPFHGCVGLIKVMSCKKSLMKSIKLLQSKSSYRYRRRSHPRSQTKEYGPSVPIDLETGEIKEESVGERETPVYEKVSTIKLGGSEEKFRELNKRIVELKLML